MDERGRAAQGPDPTVRMVVWVLAFLAGVLGFLVGLTAVVLFAVW